MSPRRWRGTCSDGARTRRVPALLRVSLSEYGAPRTRADPAELAGGEPQPAGAWHGPVLQVRVAGAPRGCGPAGGLARNEFQAAGPAPEEGEPAAALALGRLQMCARSGAQRQVVQPLLLFTRPRSARLAPSAARSLPTRLAERQRRSSPAAPHTRARRRQFPRCASSRVLVPWMVTSGVPTASPRGN